MIRLVVGVGVRGKWRRMSIFLRGMERHGMGYRVGSDEVSSKHLPSLSGGHAIPKKLLSLYFEIPIVRMAQPRKCPPTTEHERIV